MFYSSNQYLTRKLISFLFILSAVFPLIAYAAPQVASTPVLSFEQVKKFKFTWNNVADATYYRLFENPDGASGYSKVGSGYDGRRGITLEVPLFKRINARYFLQSCNRTGCISSQSISVNDSMFKSIGYLKPSTNVDEVREQFGTSISFSADGNTLAVSAIGEDPGALVQNAPPKIIGVVYVFIRNIFGNWSLQARLKASNSDKGDLFGKSLSLSADGNYLAIGAPRESSNARGINQAQNNNAARRSGAVYVFIRNHSNWSQQAYIKASNAGAYDQFGTSVSMNENGTRMAVGAPGEDSNASGINGGQTNNSASSSGAVYTFIQNGSGNWSQHAYLKASNADAYDHFGKSVSMSADGMRLAVAAPSEDSNARGVNQNQSNNSASSSGAVYVFVSKIYQSWFQQAYLKASNSGSGDRFGEGGVSINADGTSLAVGAYFESSNSRQIDQGQNNNTAPYSGAAYVFSFKNSSHWSQQAYLKASNTETRDYFGASVSISADGNSLAVGATREDSNARGVDQDQQSNSVGSSGAVYTYVRETNGDWSQQAYLKASNTGTGDHFGSAVSISGNGQNLAVSADDEASNAAGISQNQDNNDSRGSGAVYLF